MKLYMFIFSWIGCRVATSYLALKVFRVLFIGIRFPGVFCDTVIVCAWHMVACRAFSLEEVCLCAAVRSGGIVDGK